MLNRLELVSFPLITRRLSISPLTDADIESFVRYRQDPKVARFQSWDTSYSIQDAQSLVESQKGLNLPKPGDWMQLAIHLTESMQLLGDLALHRLDENELAFEIGFTIDPSHQRLGYAKEAAARLLQFLFEDVRAEFISATSDERNLASKKLLRALGFTEIPERAWTEEFKGETVRVNYFESHRGSKA